MDASIFPAKSEPSDSFDWRAAGYKYYPYNEYLRRKFGSRVKRSAWMAASLVRTSMELLPLADVRFAIIGLSAQVAACVVRI